MCQSLTERFQTDGVALAQAPESLRDIWLSKVKTDVNSNWRGINKLIFKRF